MRDIITAVLRNDNPQTSPSRLIMFKKSSMLLLLSIAGLWIQLPTTAQSLKPAQLSRIDTIFSNWKSSNPGCAVGASIEGKPVMQKVFGMADLEHQIKNKMDTIFEAGSVSKQFTAAALSLLARDGKISLDDQVRRYIPELPDYGVSLTVRQMLHHTSGLRDWGSIAAIGGWPRTTRIYTNAELLEIVHRQSALNFAPGTKWSYSNTGYNLASIIVERVSGLSFSEFTKQRIFDPLGMNHTSWRDNFRSIVERRATAYKFDSSSKTYSTLMPFENVVGAGGLLTTVEDLLKWNENFERPIVGDASFITSLQQAGRFDDGKSHRYGLGIEVGQYKGWAIFSHDGATAGYRSFLARFPEHQLSVAVLCNASNADTNAMGMLIADIFLPIKAHHSPVHETTASEVFTIKDSKAFAGLYRDKFTGVPLSLVSQGDTLEVKDGPELTPISAREFRASDGSHYLFTGASQLSVVSVDDTDRHFQRVGSHAPSAKQSAELVGTYTSQDAQVGYEIMLEKGSLILVMPRQAKETLHPLYKDAFQADDYVLIFQRDRRSRIIGFNLYDERAWNVAFVKTKIRKVGAIRTAHNLN